MSAINRGSVWSIWGNSSLQVFPKADLVRNSNGLLSVCLYEVFCQTPCGHWNFTAWKVSAVFGIFLVRIQSECGKIRIKKTPNTGTFHAVFVIHNKSRAWHHESEKPYLKIIDKSLITWHPFCKILGERVQRPYFGVLVKS